MLAARRSALNGTLALRAMLSLDPASIGNEGYALLLQTGETSDGITPPIDHQHPHHFFAELSASFSHKLGDHSSAFVYAGLPEEPALGRQSSRGVNVKVSRCSTSAGLPSCTGGK